MCCVKGLAGWLLGWLFESIGFMRMKLLVSLFRSHEGVGFLEMETRFSHSHENAAQSFA